MCNRWNESVIARHQKPTRLHDSLASAYAEAARLASLHNKGDYAVFECVGRCKSIKKNAAGASKTDQAMPVTRTE